MNKKQIENVTHALGLDYKKEPFRNRYNSDLNDSWEDLILKGYASKHETPNCAGDFMYYVNESCIDYIKDNYKKFNMHKKLLKLSSKEIIKKCEL